MNVLKKQTFKGTKLVSLYSALSPPLLRGNQLSVCCVFFQIFLEKWVYTQMYIHNSNIVFLHLDKWDSILCFKMLTIPEKFFHVLFNCYKVFQKYGCGYQFNNFPMEGHLRGFWLFSIRHVEHYCNHFVQMWLCL